MTTGSKKRGWNALDPPSFREAGEGVRTLDIQLGRLTLYQLSYTRKNAYCNKTPSQYCISLHWLTLSGTFYYLRIFKEVVEKHSNDIFSIVRFSFRCGYYLLSYHSC